MPAALPIAAMAFATVGGVATALGATLGIAFTIGATAVTWAAVATVTGLALTAISALAMKMPKPDSAGQQLNTKLDDKLPVPVTYGRTATGGSAIYRQSYGKKNRYLALVTALSIGPIAGIESYAASDTTLPFYGDPHTSVQTTPGVSGSKLYRNKLSQRWQRGQTPAPQTITQASGQPLPGSPGRLSGIAHAISIFDYDADQFPQGVPASLWVLRGLTLYDPRLDSTYPGGSGPHRRDDPATWTFSENPFLAGLDWALGRYQNGQKVHGIGARWGEVDVAAFVAGANVADANGWKVGGVVSSTDDKFAVLSTILQAGGGLPVQRGAQISVTVNAPKASTFVLTTADIIGDVEIMNSNSWRDRANSIVPSYREESQNWELYSGEELSVAEWIADDGGEKKSVEIELPLVQQAAQAHQLAAYDLCNSREFLTFNVAAKVRALNVRVGDAITFDAPELAVNGQKCLVVSREFNPADLTVHLSLKSETDSKHPYALGQSQVPPPSPALSGYDPSNPGAPDATAWSISDTVIAKDGVTIPAIVVAGEVDDPNASQIVVQYRPVGAVEWASAGDFAKTTRVIEITSVTRDTAYEIAISYRTVRGVLSDPLTLTATAGSQTIDWSAGVIVGENRPEDNATVGAPNGTEVGGRPVEEIIGIVDDTAGKAVTLTTKFEQLDQAFNAANVEIDDLRETVGSTAAAAASADAAAQHEANALAAASNAAQATTDAAQAVADAVAAQTAAQAAKTDALAAASDAGAAKSAAQAARSGAETAFANSTTAKDAAVAAKTAAETAKSQAQTQASSAAGSATAAAGSASTASTKATEAGNAAAAAAASQVSAQSAADDSQDSAAAAASSASAASTSAGQASTSASAAQTSATTATTKAAQASTSATNAATSETNAKGSENAAKTSQTAAATSATTAGQKADAAATSASTASTKASEASQSASTATTQANTASTKAGEASTSASQAATSETNANASKNAAATSATNAANSATAAGGSATAAAGSASTASTKASEAGNSAAVASAQALTAASHAAGNLIKKGVFSDGSIGEWGGSVSTITTGFTPPDGSTRVLQLKNRDSYEGDLSPWPFSTERKVRLTGHLLSFGAYKASMGVQIQDAAGTNNWILRGATPANSKVWSYIDEVVTIPATTAKIRYFIGSDGPSGASDHDLRATGLSVTDVTDSTAAAGSASAAATSASAAGTSATAAGTSANSATQSANTASSKANEAAASASSAASSASSASSSSSAAGNSATAASASDVSAKLTAASLLPSDFQQDGKFWQNGFGGLPQNLNSIVANSTFSFANVTGVGRVLQITGSSQIDIAQIGMLNLLPGRRHRFTAMVRQIAGSVSPTMQLYRIGVTPTGSTVGNGQNASKQLTNDGAWHTLTGENDSDTIISVGAASIRSLLRMTAVSSAVTIQIAFLRIDDITESTVAAGSASAAANSASQASASQAGAASSASSAQNSATSAATKAGEASTSASQASTSASNAAGSANTASQQANLSAQSATNSGSSAAAAAGSASTASTKANEASNSATAAASSLISATSAVISTLPSDFSNDGQFFTSAYGSRPEATQPLASNNGITYSYADIAGEGRVLRVTQAAGSAMPHVGARGWIKAVAGRTYRATLRVRCISGSSPTTRVFVSLLGEAGGQVAAYNQARATMVTNTWYDVTISLPGDSVIAAGAAYMRPLARLDTASTNYEVSLLRLEDVTESNAAAGSASAAASSASTASTKAGEAGQSATSASTSANTASIKAGEASLSASAAAGSAATASSAASTATTQATLTAQYSTGGGNLLTNTDFTVDTSGWDASSTHNAIMERDIAGTDWRIAGEHVLGIQQPNTSGSGYSDWKQIISVGAGNWYDVSTLVAAHRCQVQIYLQWIDANGASLNAPNGGLVTPKSGGPTLANWTQIGFKTQAPSNAVRARLILRKQATLSGQTPDSFAWFARPQVRETFSTAPTPCSYSPGNGGAVAAAQQALITTTQTAIATANSTIANHSTRLQAAEANVSQTMGAVSNLQGRTTAYWKVETNAGNGRAQLSVVSDSNGGGAVDIVGDVRISGDAMIGGTINPEALDLSRFVKKIGPASATASDARLMYAADLGVTIANGEYQLQGTIGFTYTSGRQTMTQSGRPYYIDYLNDGGLLIALTKNGQTIAQRLWTGNMLSVYGAQNFTADITTIFDDLDLDTSTGNVTLAVYSRKGNSDTGMINQGDYYTRQLSGNYYNFSMSNVKCKWRLW